MKTKAALPTIRRALAARSRIALIRADFNADITTRLEEACVTALQAAGVPAARIDRITVPGCFEIPLMAQRLARKRKYDVLIALGAVIRGDTFHFELVATECARGVMDVSLRHNVPIVFEVLAVYHRRDAVRRAGPNRLNKGLEAAAAALALLTQLDSIS